MKKGSKHSKYSKKRISISKTGKKLSEEHKKRISKSLIGRVFSKETIEKIRISNKGRKLSEETKRKMSLAKKGKPSSVLGKHWKLSQKAKNNISIGHEGINTWMLGRKLSEETKRKIGLANSGEKCYLWKGGIFHDLYPVDWTRSLKISIRERDNYTCQIIGCNKKQGDTAHPVHHIDYDKNNNDPDNLITLCHNCHPKTNINRNYWINYFKNYVR